MYRNSSGQRLQYAVTAFCTVHCALCTVHCTLYTVHCTLQFSDGVSLFQLLRLQELWPYEAMIKQCSAAYGPILQVNVLYCIALD